MKRVSIILCGSLFLAAGNLWAQSPDPSKSQDQAMEGLPFSDLVYEGKVFVPGKDPKVVAEDATKDFLRTLPITTTDRKVIKNIWQANKSKAISFGRQAGLEYSQGMKQKVDAQDIERAATLAADLVISQGKQPI